MDFYTSIQQALDFVDINVVENVTKNWRENFQGRVGTREQPQLFFGKRIFIVGNGGSCAIAEHISTDLIKRCGVKAYTLSNNSLLTALTNDYGQNNTFVEWMKMNHFGQTDFLVAISSSGKSKNILFALNHASDCLALTFSIFGMKGLDPFPTHSYDHSYIHIDNFNYGVIELTSEIILHGIVEELVIE